jgi:hypothetical protein
MKMLLNTNIIALMQGKLNMIGPETHSKIRMYWATNMSREATARDTKQPVEVISIYYAIMDADFYLHNGKFPSEWSKECLASGT